MSKRVLCFFALFAAVAAPLHAGPLTLFGIEIELTNLGPINAAEESAYLFELRLDTAGYQAPAGSLAFDDDWLKAVAIDFGTPVLAAAPVSSSDWSIATGQATAGGCAEGSNDWTCLTVESMPIERTTATWRFALEFDGDVMDPVRVASIQVLVGGLRLKPHHGSRTRSYLSPSEIVEIAYLAGHEHQAGRLQDREEDPQVQAVPEPGSLWLIGIAVFGLLLKHRRRNVRTS